MTARAEANALKAIFQTEEEKKENRREALTTKLENGIIVDTCKPIDTGFWETGIKQNGTWYVPEDYANKDDAYNGHQKWVEDMMKNPKKKLKDIHYNTDEPSFTLF